MKLIPLFNLKNELCSIVVYFNQRMGAAHSKRWSKYAYKMFFVLKAGKRKKKQENEAKFG